MGKFVNARNIDTIRIEVLGEARAVSATGGQWVDFADACHKYQDAMAQLNNDAGDLLGNTQGSDLEWFARLLFDWSNLGAGDIKTVPWLLSKDEFAALGLTHKALFGCDHPNRWDMLTEEQREAWRKLGRICLFALPRLTERIGARYEAQSKALKRVWEETRKASLGEHP